MPSPGTRVVARTLAAVGLLAAMSTSSAAHARPIDDAGRCQNASALAAGGTTAGAASARGGHREPSGWKNAPIDEAPTSPRPGFRATIPVRFHVFTDGAVGRLSEQDLRRQVSVLNAGFAGREGGFDTGFAFTYAGVDYTDNATWFAQLNPGTSVERRAKAATHVGDASTLNVWTTDGPSYLGFATFPSWFKRSPELDGVVLDYKSFVGGAFGDSFSLGKTATHEVGHWLGLLHTFQGGCNAKGDYVADTPAELTPTTGCPAGKNTCSAPGDDPVHNYMDYSFDSCYTQFTAGQSTRMVDQWSYFRASGGFSTGN